jgi:hypothetical protein
MRKPRSEPRVEAHCGPRGYHPAARRPCRAEYDRRRLIQAMLSMLITGIIINSFGSGFLTPEQLAQAIRLPVLVTLSGRK